MTVRKKADAVKLWRCVDATTKKSFITSDETEVTDFKLAVGGQAVVAQLKKPDDPQDRKGRYRGWWISGNGYEVRPPALRAGVANVTEVPPRYYGSHTFIHNFATRTDALKWLDENQKGLHVPAEAIAVLVSAHSYNNYNAPVGEKQTWSWQVTLTGDLW